MGYEWFDCIAQLTLEKHHPSLIQLVSSSPSLHHHLLETLQTEYVRECGDDESA